MTAASAVATQTVLAFDSLAAKYDDLFTRSMIGRAQREAVWDVLVDTFEPGSHILELNCGTGEDALFLARQDVSVVACDASQRMIETARQRMQAEDPDASIEFRVLATEHLSELDRGDLFDGVFSNFSGLNCVADLHLTARQLAALVTRGAPILICLSTRFCLSEMAWFVLHGQFRKAFRRSSGFATVKMGEYAVKVHYPTLRAVKKMFSPYFRMRSCTGIGVAVPPSYLEPIVRKYPRLLGWLRLIDRAVSRLPWLRTIGDHMLIHFERVEGQCY
jgi:ubiquinone/menaquinone biosynthesis C-methylase UbiE